MKKNQMKMKITEMSNLVLLIILYSILSIIPYWLYGIKKETSTKMYTPI